MFYYFGFSVIVFSSLAAWAGAATLNCSDQTNRASVSYIVHFKTDVRFDPSGFEVIENKSGIRIQLPVWTKYMSDDGSLIFSGSSAAQIVSAELTLRGYEQSSEGPTQYRGTAVLFSGSSSPQAEDVNCSELD